MRMNAKCAVAYAALLACTPSWAVATDYTKATVEPDGQLILHSADGKTQAAPRISRVHGTESQVGFEKPLLGPDRRTVGWLALFPNCCTSYPIPLELVLFRNGVVIQRIVGAEMPIWGWRFVVGSNQVAITQRPTHGAAPDHYELRDVASGQLVEEYDREEGQPPENIPQWAQGLN